MLNQENIAKALLDYRADKRATQEDVSNGSGISLSTIRHIESGAKKAQFLTIHKLQRFFDKVGFKVND